VIPEGLQNQYGHYIQNDIPDKEKGLKYAMKEIAHTLSNDLHQITKSH
jgi:hypothetical protein